MARFVISAILASRSTGWFCHRLARFVGAAFPDSKSGERATVPRVRIPPLPPLHQEFTQLRPQ